MNLRTTESFERTLEELFGSYPLAESCINDFLHKLPGNYARGDRCPGYGSNIEIRKLRIALPQYRLSAREGCRLLYLVAQPPRQLLPIAIYKKGRFKKESDAVAWLKAKLCELLAEITA